jgi:uncharacterized protein YigE (DUF2233 family)
MLSFIFGLLISTAHGAGTGYAVAHKDYAGIQFEVVTLDPAKVEIKLFWRNKENEPFATLAAVREEVRKQKRKFIFATNSGIYDLDFKPLGLHIEGGKTIRRVNKAHGSGGNFGMLPNGIFLLGKNGAKVIETSEFSSVKEPVDYATQSGPLLLRKGVLNSHFQLNSENKKLRSGVGVDSKGRVVFAISQGVVNFYDFATLYMNELDCADALYLDGTISTVLIDDAEADEQVAPFVGIWAAMEK